VINFCLVSEGNSRPRNFTHEFSTELLQNQCVCAVFCFQSSLHCSCNFSFPSGVHFLRRSPQEILGCIVLPFFYLRNVKINVLSKSTVYRAPGDTPRDGFHSRGSVPSRAEVRCPPCVAHPCMCTDSACRGCLKGSVPGRGTC